MYKKHIWQMCYDCDKALGGCAWSDRFEPVEGWEAVKTTVQRGNDRCEPIDSYNILYCPEFVPDKPITANMLDDSGCVDLLCAVIYSARDEYIAALNEVDELCRNGRAGTKDYKKAIAHLSFASEALPLEICERIKAERKKAKVNNDE